MGSVIGAVNDISSNSDIDILTALEIAPGFRNLVAGRHNNAVVDSKIKGITEIFIGRAQG